MTAHYCQHGYRYNLDRDPLGPQGRRAADGCLPPPVLVAREAAHERVAQAAYDLERAWNRTGHNPGDPLACAEALAARATELAGILRRPR